MAKHTQSVLSIEADDIISLIRSQTTRSSPPKSERALPLVDYAQNRV